MKKDLKEISCPNCQSSNITIRRKITQQELTNSEESTIKTEPIIYECTCQDCGKKFTIHLGYRNYFVCINPLPIDEEKKIHLLETFQSDSPLEKDYKIISIESKNKKEKELTYLLLTKEEEFPKIISKETVEEVKKDPPKIFYLSRFKKL